MLNVLVFGAGGVIGQHMRLCVPSGVRPVFFRRKKDLLHEGCDLTNEAERLAVLDMYRPDVVINLAGENRPDEVEKAPQDYFELNALVPGALADWCDGAGARYVHVSTQGVFGGRHAPYAADSGYDHPANAYGAQKAMAEMLVRRHRNWVIARPTFVLGVRPLPMIGRQNPVEQILTAMYQKQVSDRYFSPSFASDVARQLWRLATTAPLQSVEHLGVPERKSRFSIAWDNSRDGGMLEMVKHSSLGLPAERPADTSYAEDAKHNLSFDAGMIQCERHIEDLKQMSTGDRAREIAMFLGISEYDAIGKLQRGFHAMHAAVAEDFRRANPLADDELLEWYRKTNAYIWELSAYHCDEGFNYMGMARGIVQRLKNEPGTWRVLALGDGIGDLTLMADKAGLIGTYHDLDGSLTSEFAKFHYWRHTGRQMRTILTQGWEPAIGAGYDAILSMDFYEHVTDVEAWAAASVKALRPGGLLFAQNAFACGSGPDGSIPCHLERNDRFEKDWVPLLESLGMQAEPGNWWRKVAASAKVA